MLVVDNTRKLVRIVRIDEIKPIKKADKLEMAVIGGWEVIVKKGLYQVGDNALYFEIDSAIKLNHPVLHNFDKSYLKTTLDEATQTEYAVIKTIRLRGERSQGLLISLKDFIHSEYVYLKGMSYLPPETDVTSLLDVMKYVSSAEAKLYRASEVDDSNLSPFRRFWNNLRLKIQGDIVVDGLLAFPPGQAKSEENRIQNMSGFYQEMTRSEAGVELSVKLDGESATFVVDTDAKKISVAQRNFGLRTKDVPYTRTESLRLYTADWMRFIVRRLAGGKCSLPHWKKMYYAQTVPLVAHYHRHVIDKLVHFACLLDKDNDRGPIDFAYLRGKTISIQGEMVGPDFHNNAERLKSNRFYAYRVYVNGSTRLTPEQSRAVVAYIGLDYIPVISENFQLPLTIAEALKLADSPAHFQEDRNGVVDPDHLREGLVAKCNLTGQSLKIISNQWLEKNK